MKSKSKFPGDPWAALCDPEKGLASPRPILVCRTLVFAAHPDDETIGASTILTRLPDVTVVFLTDGAPRDPKFWSKDAKGSRTDYAHMRRQEALSALSLAGVPAQRILCLGATDQDAIIQVPALVARFTTLLCEIQPEVVLTHSYEGGHPDHDAAALIVRVASRNMKSEREGITAPQLIEMTSYHAREGTCETGTFLPYGAQTLPELAIELSQQDRARKEAMLACYESQRLVLQTFGLDRERFRLAPTYDFTRPPHSGRLWYECLGWPITGARWRELAAHAAAECQVQLCV
jgi:LmbE family N-acetylglucosaminyl deacetylase